MQASKDRSSTSCTECQRRKQKCSREWPCNHCLARKVPHLCHFGNKKTKPAQSSDSSARETAADIRGSKRDFSDAIDDSGLHDDAVPGDYGHGLKMWGYMPGHVHYNLGQPADDDEYASNEIFTEATNQVGKALAAMPPRSITDAIVNHFLTSVNHRYNSIYAPTFTQQYVHWWADRTNARNLSPHFTCLLLRILSYTTQYLTSSLRGMIEFELACSCQSLTERFSTIADQLSKNFPPSCPTLERVQEQFLKCAWLKSEGNIVEAWHALSYTIRQAQELGLDKDSGIDDLSEYDIEMRRRMWALLFVWDWQMSSWLNRPRLINQKDLSFTLPNLRLDQSSTELNLVSPFCHVALEASLARRLAHIQVDVRTSNDYTTDQITTALAEIDAFIDELPPVFRVDSTDKSFDQDHPYLVFQRFQLHAVIYMSSLMFVKPYLARDQRQPSTDHDAHYLKTGITIALTLLKIGHQMFEHAFPINAKSHMVIFCIFDPSTILCSAIIHDRDHTLPRREEAMEMIDHSITALRKLSRATKIGAASHRFLLDLVQASPALSRDSSHGSTKRHRGVDSSKSDLKSHGQSHSVSTSLTQTPASIDPTTTSTPNDDGNPSQLVAPSFPPIAPEAPIDTDIPFDLNSFIPPDPYFTAATTTAPLPPFFPHASQPLEMGGLEQIWDWEGLNLDFESLGQGANVFGDSGIEGADGDKGGLGDVSQA
ncbi:unnamed protein product [Periconia digitata]|uniref:Zn(2)-C6 fungal-type domain-containing protein n=1 Tax=Periconia digitata TaxID=1303443 RepID=A0A9W4UL58_9PLEO|nr:unnamed protein product [Periconia digitata]